MGLSGMRWVFRFGLPSGEFSLSSGAGLFIGFSGRRHVGKGHSLSLSPSPPLFLAYECQKSDCFNPNFAAKFPKAHVTKCTGTVQTLRKGVGGRRFLGLDLAVDDQQPNTTGSVATGASKTREPARKFTVLLFEKIFAANRSFKTP